MAFHSRTSRRGAGMYSDGISITRSVRMQLPAVHSRTSHMSLARHSKFTSSACWKGGSHVRECSSESRDRQGQGGGAMGMNPSQITQMKHSSQDQGCGLVVFVCYWSHIAYSILTKRGKSAHIHPPCQHIPVSFSHARAFPSVEQTPGFASTLLVHYSPAELSRYGMRGVGFLRGGKTRSEGQTHTDTRRRSIFQPVRGAHSLSTKPVGGEH